MPTRPSPSPPTGIVLNADDYGLSAGIDEGIVRLLDAGRLSGVSVMTTGPLWVTHAAALRPFAAAADIGLHFALTETPTERTELRKHGRPFTFGEVQRLAWLRQLPRDVLADELARQWTRFVDVFGHPPAHIDSHQHVHQLPRIRGAVLQFVQQLPAAQRPYVRTCYDRRAVIWARGVDRTRALAFSWAGTHLHRSLRRHGLRTNDGFSGVYDFRPRAGYRPCFQRFLRGARNTTILICHPALPGKSTPGDPIAAARAMEFDYLASADALADAAAAGVRWVRFAD